MLPERRGVIVGSDVNKGADHNSDHGLRAVRRSRRFGRRRLLFWLFSFAAICSICVAVFVFKMFFHGNSLNIFDIRINMILNRIGRYCSYQEFA